ncbi:ATP-dependent helicase [Membranihabitans maritimus]|uniref:ATP-dependent helicase n=1 Tax=Membranihabitans maritimus TaxID=2904244 RepID=UPI001F030FCD|nr:UvrD-helicase domain-containing protein [Membranihabitans maritimus]
MEEFLQGLNPVQKSAVTQINGPVMVVAGPGSGKTRVLTFRIAYMISQGIKPYNILSLTFTNKAAREMKERIEKVTTGNINSLWAGTFHSLFARILRIEAEHIGYPTSFTIYDSDDSKSLLRTIVKEMNLNKDAYPPNQILSRISSAKSNLLTPKAYVKDQNQMSADRIANRPHFHEIYAKYVNRCKKAGAMDFDDLLFRLFELFQKKPDVLEKYRERFKYILVDEFQDTNFLQYAIIRKLAKYDGSPENVCIVGDDAQSIYAFRGATIDNILDFEKDFANVKVFKLEQNYRSTPHIVDAANEVISHNKRQIKKKIWTDQEEGYKIKALKMVSDAEEGKRIADLILEYKNRFHVPNNEIAILYRTNAQSRVFEEHLRRYNIPYRIYGGQSFYQRKEIKDLMAYFRLVINPNDEEAFKRVVNFPKRGVGASTLAKIFEFAGEEGIPLFEAAKSVMLPSRARTQLNKFIKIIQSGIAKNDPENAYETAEYIANSSGLIKSLKDENTLESMNRLENVEALLNGIKDFVESDEVNGINPVAAEERSLDAYIQNIALLTDQDNEDSDLEQVTLMSVHAAKGLEFDAIFLVGMEENLFPSFMSMESDQDVDEERRLFYVAITRARKFLTLSFATSRYRFGKLVYNRPSRFLEEIGADHMENPDIIYARSGSMREETAKSGVSGIPKKRKKINAITRVAPKDFKPASPTEIEAGMQVLHLKFGKGKVLSVDGRNDSKVATIFFDEIDSPQRRIMLKFAKLQILD